MPQKEQHYYNEQLTMYRSDRERWRELYGKRALVESTNHIVKTTNRRELRGRTDVARLNEVLLMALVHNLCRLLMVRREYGLTIPFADERAMNVIRQADPKPKAVASAEKGAA